MTDYWFKPHDYGYGATPISWKGWAAVAVYAAVMLALGLSLAALPADMPEGPGAWQVATWLVMVGLLTLGFLRLCRAKTDGEWRWRWGKHADKAGRFDPDDKKRGRGSVTKECPVVRTGAICRRRRCET